jgi:5-methylcytosine-specific restriction endonuclease McrA
MAGANASGFTPACGANGCNNHLRSSGAKFCEKHYYRMRRNGHLGPKNAPPPRLRDHTAGYKLLFAPKHPIATKSQQSRVYEHRAVYYQHQGGGPFDCVHCGASLTWETMHVDHLDDDPSNNEITNLGASCPLCNQARGRRKIGLTMRARFATQITWQSRTQSAHDWAEEMGCSATMLRSRLKAGWSLDRIMTEPRGKFGPRGRLAQPVTAPGGGGS